MHHLNKEEGIDVVYAHGISTGPVGFFAGRLLRKPVVWMIHGTLESYSQRSGFYETIIMKVFRPRRCLVVDNGSGVVAKMQRLLGEDRVVPVYIYVDTDAVCPSPRDGSLARDLRIQDQFVFASVHNLSVVQGVEYAIRAFAEFLHVSHSNSLLLVIGDGPLREQLRLLAAELGIADNVKFVGAVENSRIPRFYSIADVALAPSLKVNMNRSTVEAMSCGKPVVAFDTGNTGDELIRDMDRGLLAEAGSVDDLARKMLLLYKDAELRKRVGENARAFVRQNRDWRRRVAIELEVLESALGGHVWSRE
jgi:glycosyltransferase involved in cell wall biosynthesis